MQSQSEKFWLDNGSGEIYRLDFSQRHSDVKPLFRIVPAFSVGYAFEKNARLTIPDAQERFFIRRCRIRLPNGPSDPGRFRIGPGQPPFDAAFRTFFALGALFGSKSDRTSLAANFPVPGALHHFINFHLSYSFDIPE